MFSAFSRIRRRMIALTALAALLTCGPVAHATTASPFGANLDRFRSYNPDWVTVDAFVKARDWIPGARQPGGGGRIWDVCHKDNEVFDRTLCDTTPPLTLDARGWATATAPGVIPHTLLYDELDGDFPAGRYILLFEGSGVVRVDGSVDEKAPGGCGRTRFKTGRGCFTVTRPDARGIHVWIDESDANNPVRNVRLIVPGGVEGFVDDQGAITRVDASKLCTPARERGSRPYTLEPGEQCIDLEYAHWNRFGDPVEWINTRRALFHPNTVDYLSSFSVLRFMNWLETNDSTVTTWDDSARVDDANWTSSERGVPPIVMLKLANAAGATPWVNIPHAADVAWSQRFADLCAQHLSPELDVIVEWSNEVWNHSFSQTKWAEKYAEDNAIPGKRSGIRVSHVVAERTLALAPVWRNVLGGRARGMIASQASNPRLAKDRLAWNDAWRHVDALAIAPYFGHGLGELERASALVEGGLDALFTALEQDDVFGKAQRAMTENKAVAARYKLDLIAYEAGQHLAGRGKSVDRDDITELFTSANADARMGALYHRYFDAWRAAGGSLMVHYAASGRWNRWGSWGLKRRESDTRETSPRLDALLRYAEQHGCWWANCAAHPIAGTSARGSGVQIASRHGFRTPVARNPVTGRLAQQTRPHRHRSAP